MAEIGQIGKYEIVEELGSGGFATVYRAVDTSLGRQVALKVLHPQLLIDPVFVQRFRQEARTIATLRHPHIITIYEIGEVSGRLFISMDLAPRSLATRLAQAGALPWGEALALLHGTAEALDYAHAQGVIHRDLKPANILLDGADEPLISDFGFARIVGGASMSMSLSAGAIVGTPGYIAPEVWDANAATPAADIYALGCVAYELLSGLQLFAAATPMQAMRAHDRGPQLSAGWAGAGVPPGVDALLHKALARDPEDRFSSALEFWRALRALEDDAATRLIPVARPAPAVAPATAPVIPAAVAAPASARRPGWLFPVLGVGALALLGVGYLLFGRGDGGQQATAQAAGQATTFAIALATARAEGVQGGVQTVQAQATATGQALAFAVALATARAEGVQGGVQTVQADATLAAAAAVTSQVANASATASAANASATASAANASATASAADGTAMAVVGATETAAAQVAQRPTLANTAPAVPARPTPTARPQSPTLTLPPAATAPASAPGAVVDGRSVGELFTGTARQGAPLASSPGTATCIQGTVKPAGGGLFRKFYVQADKSGDTRPAKHFYDTGNYQLCGLEAGEWGVAVYAVNEQNTSGREQQAHQVRFRASGQTGEIFYIDFVANAPIAEPTAAPAAAPTAAPFTLFDGDWVGKLSASSPIAPDGRFSFSIRAGRLVSLGASGAACFWTHNAGLSLDVSGSAFSFSGAPNQGTNTSSYSVQGRFDDANRASGSLSANDAAGNPCLVGGTWTATRQ